MIIEQATHTDFPEISAVLSECGLPMGNLTPPDMERFMVVRAGRCIVGVAAMVVQGQVAIAHSFAVVPGFRGMGLGRKLASGLLDWGFRLGLDAVYLFTCQAEFYFRAMEFTVVPIHEVPEAVVESLEAICDSQVVRKGHILCRTLESALVRTGESDGDGLSFSL